MTEELLKQLIDDGYVNPRVIEGRGICALRKFLFTVAIVYDINENSYAGRYCYPSAYDAVISFDKWDGKEDPPGNWIKHKGHTEYSNPYYER